MSIARKVITGDSGGSDGPGGYVDDVFSTYLYTGTSANQDITNGIDLADKGGFVWFKNRTTAYQHMLFDTERGATKFLSSDTTQVETTDTTSLTSFNSDGFSIGAAGEINNSGTDVVSWSFAKQEGFFDVVTYTGNSTAGREIPHNLGSTPGMIIVKCLTDTKNWRVYHTSLGADYWLELNETGDKVGPSAAIWNSTEPTSTVFTVGSSITINGSGQEYVAYLFADNSSMFGPNGNESIIKCGVLDANNYNIEEDLGWEPQWILMKETNGASNWKMVDSMRGSVDPQPLLYPNEPDAEVLSGAIVEFTARGFKQSILSGVGQGIYMAIRRPMKPAEEFEPDELFSYIDRPLNETPGYVTNFPVDFVFEDSTPTQSANKQVFTRGTGTKGMVTNTPSALTTNDLASFAFSDGWYDRPSWNYSAYLFRRAPGLLDIINYKGSGVSGSNIPHGLGTEPELIWVRNTDSASEAFYIVATSNLNQYNLTTSDGIYRGPEGLYNSVTSTNLVSGSSAANQLNQNYTAILFKSHPGVLHTGVYTFSKPEVVVDCGFTNGAKFVLIKQISGNGAGHPWYYWNAENAQLGITNGDDKYLELNTDRMPQSITHAGYDTMFPHPSGFIARHANHSDHPRITSTGEQYLYMAIA